MKTVLTVVVFAVVIAAALGCSGVALEASDLLDTPAALDVPVRVDVDSGRPQIADTTQDVMGTSEDALDGCLFRDGDAPRDVQAADTRDEVEGCDIAGADQHSRDVSGDARRDSFSNGDVGLRDTRADVPADNDVAVGDVSCLPAANEQVALSVRYDGRVVECPSLGLRSDFVVTQNSMGDGGFRRVVALDSSEPHGELQVDYALPHGYQIPVIEGQDVRVVMNVRCWDPTATWPNFTLDFSDSAGRRLFRYSIWVTAAPHIDFLPPLCYFDGLCGASYTGGIEVPYDLERRATLRVGDRWSTDVDGRFVVMLLAAFQYDEPACVGIPGSWSEFLTIQNTWLSQPTCIDISDCSEGMLCGISGRCESNAIR